jgi:hypothetical protein
MTLDEVKAAVQQIEAAGLTPSCNRVIERVGGNKRDVARLRHAGPG